MLYRKRRNIRSFSVFRYSPLFSDFCFKRLFLNIGHLLIKCKGIKDLNNYDYSKPLSVVKTISTR